MAESAFYSMIIHYTDVSSECCARRGVDIIACPECTTADLALLQSRYDVEDETTRVNEVKAAVATEVQQYLKTVTAPQDIAEILHVRASSI